MWPKERARIRAEVAYPTSYWESLCEQGTPADVLLTNLRSPENPATIQEHSTYEQPHQLSTGVETVLVNGVEVVRDGRHTGSKPGRIVRGSGWRGGPDGE